MVGHHWVPVLEYEKKTRDPRVCTPEIGITFNRLEVFFATGDSFTKKLSHDVAASNILPNGGEIW